MQTHNHRLAAAVHIANMEIRAVSQHDADRAHDRLVDVVEASQYPNLFLAHLVKKLGRDRSLAVRIEPDAIKRALRS